MLYESTRSDEERNIINILFLINGCCISETNFSSEAEMIEKFHITASCEEKLENCKINAIGIIIG